MLLIGINGRYTSGKDTLAEAIAENLPNRRVHICGFADKLKLSAMIALGWSPKDAKEARELSQWLKQGFIATTMPTGKPKMTLQPDKSFRNAQPAEVRNIAGRVYLQRYGTESHRDIFGDNFWVDALLPPEEADLDDYMGWHFPGVDVVFVTDLRFDNEAERINDLGGQCWVVNAEERLGPLADDAHPSERGISDQYVAGTLVNNGTREEWLEVAKIMAENIEEELSL